MTGLWGQIVMLVVGVVLGWVGNWYFYWLGQDETIARYVVASMSHRCPPKDSKEIDARIQSYLDALKRSKADGRGGPVWRDDCTIGVDWQLNLSDTIQAKD